MLYKAQLKLRWSCRLGLFPLWVPSCLPRPALLFLQTQLTSRLNFLLFLFSVSTAVSNPTVSSVSHDRVNHGQRIESRRHQSLHGPRLPNCSVLISSLHIYTSILFVKTKSADQPDQHQIHPSHQSRPRQPPPLYQTLRRIHCAVGIPERAGGRKQGR